MSASANIFCIVKNLDDIQISLVPENKTKQEKYRDDDWDNRWNWDTSEFVYEDESQEKKNLWLQDCIIAISPFRDILVIGRSKVISVSRLLKQQNSSDNSSAFKLCHTTTLQGEPDETITSIVLLPFVSHQKTAVSFPDWTAIVVGFSSGYFRIFNENGKVLISNLFHDEPILDIKCRTYSINNLLAEQTDEILIVYPTAVVQIDGFTLFQTLRSCPNRLMNDSNSQQQYEEQTPFTFNKWAFNSDDGRIYDCVNVCSFIKNDFDAMVSHSLDARKPMTTNEFANLFFTTGTNPYIGFFRTQKGSSHAIIDELSQLLMNRVNSLFNLSIFKRPTDQVNPKEKIKPSKNVSADLSLYDERLGLKICLSPNRRLAAVTDDFGRVILFDMQNLVAVRIWKGYRKAEVGWIVVEDEVNEKSQDCNPKQAHFLVIYAQKRGILEIWCAQNGPRVTAFNVGKNCKLLYTDHTMFGLNHLVLQKLRQSMSNLEFQRHFPHSRCFLFNFETGNIFHFNVPFLCSLTDRNSKRTRDMHILKDLKNLLRKEVNGEKEKYYAEAVKLISMLKTAEIRRESIDLIRSVDDPELISFCCQKLLDDLLQSHQKNELDFENKLIAQMCSRIIQICRFYIKIKEQSFKLEEKLSNLIVESQNPPDIHQLVENLEGWTDNDVVRILSLLAFRQSVLNQQEDQPYPASIFQISISEMLSHFTLYYNHLVKPNCKEEQFEKLPVEIIVMKDEKNGTNSETGNNNTFINMDKLSCFLFYSTFCGEESNLDDLLDEVCIFPSNLLFLLFNAWLNSLCSTYWPCWKPFSKAFIRIVNIINEESECDEKLFNFSSTDDHLSLSWTDIITLIYKSENIPSAFIAINMIKALIHKVKLEKKAMAETISEDKSLFPLDNDWETLHLDKENLNLLAKQLEDLFLLDLLLKSSSSSFGQVNSQQSEFLRSNQNLENISLSFILTSGPGIVSEIVARWAVHHKIKPILLVSSPRTIDDGSNDDDDLNKEYDKQSKLKNDSAEGKNHVPIESSRIEIGSSAVNEMSTLSARSTLIEILDHVRRCFPNCLDSDVLLINCFWEILLQWHSQPLIYTGESLPRALDYLENVSSSVLKHNVATMAWRLFVQQRFEILCNLIEKMHKKPKDRIIRKELEMDENNLERFADFCCDILDFMIRTSASSEIEPLPLYTVDDWWQSFNSSIKHYNYNQDMKQHQYSAKNNDDREFTAEFINNFQPSPTKFSLLNRPLAVMAMHQKTPNIYLLIEYHHLAQSILFIVIFSLKNVSPLTLFPSSIRAYFFKPDMCSFLSFDSSPSTSTTAKSILNAKDFATSNVSSSISLPSDPVLTETRLKFLRNIITNGIVQIIPAFIDDNEDRNASQKYCANASKWFTKVIGLARKWNLEVDQLRIQYVHDLFLYGLDPLAQELIATVSAKNTLGSQLLIIAGRRIYSMLNSKYSSLDEVSFLAPNVLFWLKSLVTDPNCFNEIPKSYTISLLENILNMINDNNSADYRICEELLTAFKSI